MTSASWTPACRGARREASSRRRRLRAHSSRHPADRAWERETGSSFLLLEKRASYLFVSNLAAQQEENEALGGSVSRAGRARRRLLDSARAAPRAPSPPPARPDEGARSRAFRSRQRGTRGFVSRYTSIWQRSRVQTHSSTVTVTFFRTLSIVARLGHSPRSLSKTNYEIANCRAGTGRNIQPHERLAAAREPPQLVVGQSLGVATRGEGAPDARAQRTAQTRRRERLRPKTRRRLARRRLERDDGHTLARLDRPTRYVESTRERGDRGLFFSVSFSYSRRERGEDERNKILSGGKRRTPGGRLFQQEALMTDKRYP